MEKIWILKSSNRFTKNYRIYKSKDDLIRRLSRENDYTILEYELKSSTSSLNYFKEQERDIQLRCILDELSNYEINMNNLIVLFEKLAPQDTAHFKYLYKTRTYMNNRDGILELLNKDRASEKQIKAILTRDKKYFIGISDSLEWYCALLKIHNFMDPYTYKGSRYVNGKYERIMDVLSEESKNNFYAAKNQIKKKPTKVKKTK